MATKNKPDELSLIGLKRVLKKTGVAVKADNLGRGIPMTVVENGQIVELHPNGSKRIVKKHVAPPVRVAQTRFTLE